MKYNCSTAKQNKNRMLVECWGMINIFTSDRK